jgi:hypothetical protein
MIKESRKVFHLFLSIYLCLTVFSISSRPDVCLCGDACAHVLYDEQPNNTLPYHKRCHHSDCKTCNVEKGSDLYAKAPLSPEYTEKGCGFPNITTARTHDPLSDYALLQFDLVHSVIGYSPPLVYLQNCSFLC